MRFVDAVVYIYSNVKDRVSFGPAARNLNGMIIL